jgi:hypothetical protein
VEQNHRADRRQEEHAHDRTRRAAPVVALRRPTPKVSVGSHAHAASIASQSFSFATLREIFATLRSARRELSNGTLFVF